MKLTLNNVPCMKSYISCNSIIGLQVITVICLGSHLYDSSGVIIEKNTWVFIRVWSFKWE